MLSELEERKEDHDRLFYEIAYHVMFKENYVIRVKRKHNRATEGNENKGLLSLVIADGKYFETFLLEEPEYFGTTSMNEVLKAVANEEDEDDA